MPTQKGRCLRTLIGKGLVSFGRKSVESRLHPRSNACYLPYLIATTAFVFSSSWTIPLYASLRSSMPPAAAKRRRRFPFRTLIVASVAITVVLVLPLCIFASYSNRPVSTSLSCSSPKFADLERRTLQRKGQSHSWRYQVQLTLY